MAQAVLHPVLQPVTVLVHRRPPLLKSAQVRYCRGVVTQPATTPVPSPYQQLRNNPCYLSATSAARELASQLADHDTKQTRSVHTWSTCCVLSTPPLCFWQGEQVLTSDGSCRT